MFPASATFAPTAWRATFMSTMWSTSSMSMPRSAMPGSRWVMFPQMCRRTNAPIFCTSLMSRFSRGRTNRW